MKASHIDFKALVTASIIATSSSIAVAITPGITDVNGVLINPFTNLDVSVWRLVGQVDTASGKCTMVQLSPDLVVTARHCGNVSGRLFDSPLSINAQRSEVLNCLQNAPNDYQLCKLKNPERFQAPPSYPPITTSPYGPDASAVPGNVKWGQFLAVGRSKPAYAAFYDGALQQFGHDYDYPTEVDQVNFNPGDSGGALYWISPTSHIAAYVGDLVGSMGIVIGVVHFTQADVNWVLSSATALGAQAPTAVTAQAHYGGSPNDPPPPLGSFQTKLTSLNSALVTWAPPTLTATQSIVGYKVTQGIGSQASNSITVSNGQSTSVSLTVGPETLSRVCVVPYNAIGPAGANAYNSCRNIDARTPGAAQALTVTSASGTLPSLRRVAATWQASTTPDTVTGSYQVVVTQTFSNGMKQTAKQTQTAASLPAITVQKGVRVCVAVTAIGANDIPARTAASQCINTDL